MWINGRHMGGGLLPPDRATHIQIPLPEEFDRVSGRVELLIAIEDSFVPAECFPDWDDPREHGVAIERIWFAR